MNLLLISIALVIPTFVQTPNQPQRGKSDDKMSVQKLDGAWTVTYAEKDGKKLDIKSFTEVTIKNNVATCRHEGKEKSWRMEFGPHNMIRCTEMIEGKPSLELPQEKRDVNEKGFHTHYGVYIASPDFFCLGLNKGTDHRNFTATERREGEARAAQPGAMPRFGEQGAMGSHFVVILHRVGPAPAAGSR